EYLESSGYEQYEISNWAMKKEERGKKKEYYCQHNLQYWKSLPYLGLGAGAHGYVNGIRYSNVLRIKTYIERFINYESRITNYQFPLTPATINHKKQTEQENLSDYMLNNLRLVQAGVAESDFRSR
ncbi:MAG: hypothetical protein JNJ43_15655, partial [Anaerolineales bacterium]|nr:hypothetical protein [Anaerolineales bacterium]